MATLRANSSPAAQFGFQVITAIGSGALFPSRMLAVQADQDENDLPMAVSFVVFIMGLGQAFGVGVGGQAFQSQWDALVEQAQKVPGKLPAQFVIPGSDAQSAAFIFDAFPQDIQILYRDINAKALSTVWIVLATAAGVAFLSSLFMKDLTLDKNRGSQAQYDRIEE